VTCVRSLLALLACAGALGACGGEERAADATVLPTTSLDAPAVTVPEEGTRTTPTVPVPGPEPAVTSTAPATPEPADAPAAPADANPGGASAEGAGTGGAGDEDPIRQPARFALAEGAVRPASVRVAPFLTVALEVVGAAGSTHRVALIGTDVAFEVPAGKTVRRTLPGLAAGMYTLSVDDGADAASLVVGDEAAG
jgi:hypothetical protein